MNIKIFGDTGIGSIVYDPKAVIKNDILFYIVEKKIPKPWTILIYFNFRLYYFFDTVERYDVLILAKMREKNIKNFKSCY